MKNYISIVFFICTVNLFCQVSAPKYANEFLQIGVGARAMGMSGAQVASVGDVTSGYWNPSGLLDLSEKWEVATMHNEYFAGIAKYDYIAAGKKLIAPVPLQQQLFALE